MKSLKFVSVIMIAAGIFFSSCKKEKETTITKDQLVGTWKTVIVTSVSQEVLVKLKAGQGAELDVQPYDGIPEFVGVWELNGNNFAIHFPSLGTAEVVKFDATVSSANSISGNFKINPPAPVQSGTFTMDKQ